MCVDIVSYICDSDDHIIKMNTWPNNWPGWWTALFWYLTVFVARNGLLIPEMSFNIWYFMSEEKQQNRSGKLRELHHFTMIEPLEWGADIPCAISWHNVIQYIFSHLCWKPTAGKTAETFSFTIIPLSRLSHSIFISLAITHLWSFLLPSLYFIFRFISSFLS